MGLAAAVGAIEPGVEAGAAAAEAALAAVSTLLGHHSISVTADIYGHVSEPVTRAAIDGLTQRLGL